MDTDNRKSSKEASHFNLNNNERRSDNIVGKEVSFTVTNQFIIQRVQLVKWIRNYNDRLPGICLVASLFCVIPENRMGEGTTYKYNNMLNYVYGRF